MIKLYFQLLFIIIFSYFSYPILLPKDLVSKIDIKCRLKKFLKLNDLKNINNSFHLIDYVKLTSYGFTACIDISSVTSYSNFKNYKDYLIQLFRADNVIFTNNSGNVYLDVIYHVSNLSYKFIDLDSYKLLLGYDYKQEPIFIDMKVTPHLLVTGLSNQGKTGMIKCIIKNLRNSNIILCNAFDEDFKEFNIQNIKGEENILKLLNSFLISKKYCLKPTYIFIEELGVIKNKELINCIKDLLCVARHYNIYIIGVIQIATKEELKFKSYFNARVSFKQQDLSSYQVALGCQVSNDLNVREFYSIADTLVKGKTYNF